MKFFSSEYIINNVLAKYFNIDYTGGKLMKIDKRKKITKVLLLVIIMLIFSYSAAAELKSNKNELLITAENLKQKIDKEEAKIKIIDVRTPLQYLGGHLPQAVHMTKKDFSKPGGWVKGLIPSPKDFSGVLKNKGINNDSKIIIYGSKKDYTPYRLIFILHFYGHQSVKVLQGGFESWNEKGYQKDYLPHQNEKGDFTVKSTANNLIINTNTAANNLNNNNLILLDNRNKNEFRGSRKSAAAFRKGRIPASVHFDWEENFNPKKEVLKKEKLLKKYQKIGATKEKEIVIFSNKSFKAAHSFYILKSLGYNKLKLYDEGWLGWSSRRKLPVKVELD